MSQQRIDLWPLKKKLSVASRQLEDAERKVREAADNLRSTTTEVQNDLVHQLKEGMTTGDPLQDHGIQIFGFGSDGLKNLLQRNELFIQGRGRELLVVFRDEKPVHSSGKPTSGGIIVCHCIFGTLSGKPLQIIPKEERDLSVLIPFEKYVTGRYYAKGEEFDSETSQTGPYVILQASIFAAAITPVNSARFFKGIENDSDEVTLFWGHLRIMGVSDQVNSFVLGARDVLNIPAKSAMTI